jgi:hypothetical protein
MDESFNLSFVNTCKCGKANTERLMKSNVKMPEESLLLSVRKVIYKIPNHAIMENGAALYNRFFHP